MYSEKLKDPRWQKKRLEILQRDGWRCTKCGEDKTTLHVHHVNYCGNPWEVDNILLVTLCEKCHFIIESFKEFTILKIKKLGVKGYAAFTSTDVILITFEDGNEYSAMAMSFKNIGIINEICEKLNG